MHSLDMEVDLPVSADSAGKPAEREAPVAEARPSALAALDGLVSVVTPARNMAWCIEEVVRCVAQQTIAPLEHIIVDDGSVDGTVEIVARLQATHPRVVLLSQPQLGSAAARNRGIEYARGRYIAFLDGDDYWRERKIERQVRYMERHGALFTYGDYDRVDGRTGIAVAHYDAPASVEHADLLYGCPIGCLTAAYNQEVLGKFYMPGVARGHDWGLWLRLTRAGQRAEKFPGTEAVYRCHRGSLSADKFRKGLDIYRIYRTDEGMSVGAALHKLACHAFLSCCRRRRGRRCLLSRRPSERP